MTDQRSTDELESRMRDGFRSGELPAAPDGLRAALERVPDAPVGAGRARHDGGRRSGSRSGWGVIGLAAVLALSGAVALAVGQRSPSPGPAPLSSSPAPSAADPSPAAAIRITYEAVWTADHPANAADLNAIGTVLRKRLDATGVTGYALNKADDSRFTLDLPPGINPESIRRIVSVTGNAAFVPLGDTPAEIGDQIDTSSALFGSEGVSVASVGTDQVGGRVVTIGLTAEAAETFRAWTARNIGSYLAITIDGVALTVPVVQSEISGGQVQISVGDPGGWAPEDASWVASMLSIGPLPVPIREVAAVTLPGGSPPVPVATGPVPESPSPAGFALAPLRSDLGCDTIPAPYESFVIRIDPTAAETVWAVADTGVRLRTEWGPSFRGLVGPPATVVDDGGLSLADGSIVRTPNGAWPVIGGHFVCPSGDMVSIFDEPPPA